MAIAHTVLTKVLNDLRKFADGVPQGSTLGPLVFPKCVLSG